MVNKKTNPAFPSSRRGKLLWPKGGFYEIKEVSSTPITQSVLDGGASSGLYYKGQMITTPGRELSNALIVKRR